MDVFLRANGASFDFISYRITYLHSSVQVDTTCQSLFRLHSEQLHLSLSPSKYAQHAFVELKEPRDPSSFTLDVVNDRHHL